MFSKSCAVSLLQDARNLITEMRHAPSADLAKALTLRKMSRACNDTYYNNLFRFCRHVFKTRQSKEFFIKEFNQMINFIENCDIIENCRSFVGDKRVLSNLSALNTCKSGNADLVLLASPAISDSSVILKPSDARLLGFAKQNDLPVYVTTSSFNIDMHSMYSPALCFSPAHFKGVISEKGLESFALFINSSRDSFNWLFF
ncbi:hypothetical protein GF358_00885 [Candidatus Woesearchaeota archaeon]|nr:hypothetical protein [Candidatus Woesearchaeota archaeon]